MSSQKAYVKVLTPSISESDLTWKQGHCRPISKLTSKMRQLGWALIQYGLPGGSVVKNLPAKVGDKGLIPGWGSSLKKGMATHSSILAWEIPWTEEPGGLQSDTTQRLYNNIHSIGDIRQVAFTARLPNTPNKPLATFFHSKANRDHISVFVHFRLTDVGLQQAREGRGKGGQHTSCL